MSRLLILNCIVYICTNMRRSRGGGERGPDPPPPLENQKAKGFQRNKGPDPLEKHKATKPAFNVEPLSAVALRAIWILSPLIN